ncbi:MAG: DUF4062 domain-containing protein [Tannerella sp.]|jgi:energy-coupling factor transporter ATP-binding protein EcfA2|nr:DUF4062 domain-containing protein [Tannerella sp.]
MLKKIISQQNKMQQRYSKTIRIFVSSTFEDIKEERDYLHQHAFYNLEQYCLQRSWQFQVIDLRWGITEEASIDHKTMDICLNEIKRSKQLSPRPNFLVLLGDRYGWCPLPRKIRRDIVEKMKLDLSEDERNKHLLNIFNTWYGNEPDTNQLPEPVYWLRSRSEEPYLSNYQLFQEKVEEPLQCFFSEWATKNLPTIDEVGYTPISEQRLNMTCSATELEIHEGALKEEYSQNHICVVFRSSPQKDVSFKLENLKKRIRNKGFKINEYQIEDEKTETYLKLLSEVVENHFIEIIDAEIKNYQQYSFEWHENNVIEQFINEKTKAFSGYSNDIQTVINYIKSTEKRPFLLYGHSGCGKSTLIAQCIKILRQENNENTVILSFVGYESTNTNLQELLYSISNKIFSNANKHKFNIPHELNVLKYRFREYLLFATKERPLILFIDAINQLNDFKNEAYFNWLPHVLPDHVKIIISITTEGYTIVKEKYNNFIVHPLSILTGVERENMLKIWLLEKNRTLTQKQYEYVLGKFKQSGSLPLYLRIALDFISEWKSTDNEYILSETIDDLFDDFISNLPKLSHQPLFVKKILSVLYLTRYGMSDDEIQKYISNDKSCLELFCATAFHKYSSNNLIQKIPPIIWIRLYNDLEIVLSRTVTNGTELITFYHQLFENSIERFIFQNGVDIKEEYKSLSLFFTSKEIPLLDTRRSGELPYSLLKAGEYIELTKLLTDFDFIYNKVSQGMKNELINDYLELRSCIPGSFDQKEKERINYLQDVEKQIYSDKWDEKIHSPHQFISFDSSIRTKIKHNEDAQILLLQEKNKAQVLFDNYKSNFEVCKHNIKYILNDYYHIFLEPKFFKNISNIDELIQKCANIQSENYLSIDANRKCKEYNLNNSIQEKAPYTSFSATEFFIRPNTVIEVLFSRIDIMGIFCIEVLSNGKIIRWNITNRDDLLYIETLFDFRSKIDAASISLDSKTIALISDGRIIICNTFNRKYNLIKDFKTYFHTKNFISMTASAKWIVFLCGRHAWRYDIFLYDIHSGSLESIIPPKSEDRMSPAFCEISDDSKFLVLETSDGRNRKTYILYLTKDRVWYDIKQHFYSGITLNSWYEKDETFSHTKPNLNLMRTNKNGLASFYLNYDDFRAVYKKTGYQNNESIFRYQFLSFDKNYLIAFCKASKYDKGDDEEQDFFMMINILNGKYKKLFDEKTSILDISIDGKYIYTNTGKIVNTSIWSYTHIINNNTLNKEEYITTSLYHQSPLIHSHSKNTYYNMISEIRDNIPSSLRAMKRFYWKLSENEQFYYGIGSNHQNLFIIYDIAKNKRKVVDIENAIRNLYMHPNNEYIIVITYDNIIYKYNLDMECVQKIDVEWDVDATECNTQFSMLYLFSSNKLIKFDIKTFNINRIIDLNTLSNVLFAKIAPNDKVITYYTKESIFKLDIESEETIALKHLTEEPQKITVNYTKTEIVIFLEEDQFKYPFELKRAYSAPVKLWQNKEKSFSEVQYYCPVCKTIKYSALKKVNVCEKCGVEVTFII